MPVELKKGQKVSLEKKGASLGEVSINLNWSQPEPKKGWFGSKSQGIDLDLGCLYECKDGTKGCIQALGNAFGNLNTSPYIALDGDDRTGSCSDGENLRVNGNNIAQIKRILIYSFIYEGVVNWQGANGIVTVRCPGSQDIIVRMDEYNTSQKMCAIAMLENNNDETFNIEKIIRFYSNHQDMDQAFAWGLGWKPGRK